MRGRYALVTGLIVTQLLLAQCGRPPLRVSSEAGAVVIDMQTLGEYPSDVGRVRLTDPSTNQVIWEVEGRDEPQLGRVRLQAGQNAAAIQDVRHGSYSVVIPSEGATFMLKPGVQYRLEVWGKDGKADTKREVEVVVGSSPGHGPAGGR